MSEIQGNSLVTDTNNQTNINSNTSIEQNLNVSGFETFQRKVANKSLCRRAIGFITGAAGAAVAAVGGIFAIKVGVAAMVGALAGLVGAAAAPFVLIGMGALCIADIIGGIVFFVKNSRENVYIRELKNLLQSEGVENKKQAVDYLSEMISKHKEGSVEYNAAVRFLNENTEIFKLCLESKDSKLVDETIKFLTEVSKNKCEKTKHFVGEIIVDCLNLDSTELNTDAATLLATFLKDNDTKSLAYEIIKSEGFSETIQRFLKSKNDGLKINTIDLLTEMLKNENTKGTAEGIIKDHIKSDNTQLKDGAVELLTALSKDKSVQTTVVKIVKNCLNENDLKLRSNAIKLLTEMLKNGDTKGTAEGFIKNYSGKIGEWLESDNNELKANTIALLTGMFKSENTNLANIAKKIITDSPDKGVVIEGQGFADIIKSCLGSGNDGLKAKVVELLNNMLVGSDDKLKNKSREILKSDVLNTKGMVNIFLKKEGKVNKDAISLLKPMCKDEEIKNTLSGLIGKDLVEKLKKQENEVKSDDVVNVLYENVIVKEIFSEGNKKHIIDILKNQDGLHSIDINFDENGQITEVKRKKLKVFFKDGKLNLGALNEQAIGDFGRCLKSIAVNGNIIKINRNNYDNNSEILEKCL